MRHFILFILTTTITLAEDGRYDGGGGGSLVTKATPGHHTSLITTPKPDPEKDKWLIYVSAGPTVFIFIICVIGISVQKCSEVDDKNDGGRSDLNPSSPRVKPKPKLITEVYDKMLEQFKDDKHKNNAYIGRKCSRIQIRGVESGSPKSLARKHMIIGKLTGTPSIEEEDENPIAALVARSTTTFIGGALLQDIGKKESADTEDSEEINNAVKEILRKSLENITAADRRTFCDELDEILLPEDLEEAFNNFDYWQESDI